MNHSANYSSAKINKVIVLAFIILFLLMLGLFGFLILRQKAAKGTDPEREFFVNGYYQAVFTSMFPIENFREEDFATYRGFQTFISKAQLTDMNRIQAYLDMASDNNNLLKTMYIGIDPEMLCRETSDKENRLQEQLSILTRIMQNHPNITFEILLSFPEYSYWAGMTEKEMDETLSHYQSVGDYVTQIPSCKLYYFCEDWLITDTDSYEKYSQVKPELTKKLMLLSFCDGYYQTDASQLKIQLKHLKQFIQSEKEHSRTYADLSGKYLVFLGDSIMITGGPYHRIPDIIGYNTNAGICNLSQGGTPAAIDGSPLLTLCSMVSCLDNDNADNYVNTEFYKEGLEQYCKDIKNGVAKEENMVFIISMGMNDYLNAHALDNKEEQEDTYTYAGALRVSIRKLQNKYPKATVILTTPTICTEFSNGSKPTAPSGYPLQRYVETAIEIAKEFDLPYIDNSKNYGIYEENYAEYMADTVHPNGNGCLLLARKMCHDLAQILIK